MSSLRVDPVTCEPADLAPAVEWLRAGGIVVFPTDTFYGLAVDPASAAAVKELCALKGRAAGAALPLVAASKPQVEAFCGPLGSVAGRLAWRFWPGPLSLIFDAPETVAPEVHGGTHTIAVRVPAHRIARMLCSSFGVPLTATSANRSGEPAVVSADTLAEWSVDRRVLVIDGGTVVGGAPSTIVDARGSAPVLVRHGAITWNRVLESLKE
jgi:L-threonylcarbamoyladenylate synthase